MADAGETNTANKLINEYEKYMQFVSESTVYTVSRFASFYVILSLYVLLL